MKSNVSKHTDEEIYNFIKKQIIELDICKFSEIVAVCMGAYKCIDEQVYSVILKLRADGYIKG